MKWENGKSETATTLINPETFTESITMAEMHRNWISANARSAFVLLNITLKTLYDACG